MEKFGSSTQTLEDYVALVLMEEIVESMLELYKDEEKFTKELKDVLGTIDLFYTISKTFGETPLSSELIHLCVYDKHTNIWNISAELHKQLCKALRFGLDSCYVENNKEINMDENMIDHFVEAGWDINANKSKIVFLMSKLMVHYSTLYPMACLDLDSVLMKKIKIVEFLKMSDEKLFLENEEVLEKILNLTNNINDTNKGE